MIIRTIASIKDKLCNNITKSSGHDAIEHTVTFT